MPGSNKLRPLLPNATPPASTEENASSSQAEYSVPTAPLVKFSRMGVRAACELCRRKKTRCNGARPACGRCLAARAECIYRDDEAESEAAAAKRSHEQAKAELDQLRELYSMMHTRTEKEAQEIFYRIRANADPLAVLHLVKSADLLLLSSSPDEGGERAASLQSFGQQPPGS